MNGYTGADDGNRAPIVVEGLPALFFIYELNPVAPKAQKKVPVPEGLDLDAWINAPLPDLMHDVYSDDSDSVEDDGYRLGSGSKPKSKKKKSKQTKRRSSAENDEEKERVRINCG